MEHNRSQDANSSNGGKRSKTEDARGEEFPSDNGPDDLDDHLVAHEEDIHQGNPRNGIQNASSDAHSVLVHVHLFGMKWIGVVSERPPLAILATDDETIPARDEGLFGLLFVLVVMSSKGPGESIALGIFDDLVSAVQSDEGWSLLVVLRVMKDNNGGDGLEIEEVAHLASEGNVIRNCIDARNLHQSSVKCLIRPVIRGNDYLALLLGKRIIAGKKLGCKELAICDNVEM